MNHMKHLKQGLWVAVVACVGCSGGSDYRQGTVSPPPSATTDFSAFVSAQYLTPPSETATPENVETTNFTFADDDNPNAFDSVVATAP